MHDRIPRQLWMLLPHAERDELARVFDIPSNGVREIRDAEVVSDGRDDNDLLAITAEKMAAYVGYKPGDAETPSFLRLWELTCSKARSIVNPPAGALTSQDDVMNIEEVVSVDEEGVHTVNATITSPKPSKNAKGPKAKGSK